MVIYKLTGTEKETMKEEISSLLKKREEIIFSYIHGSFLEGDFRNIDMAIYLKDEKNTMQYELKIEREIEDVTGFPVDVRILNRAPLSFRFNVIKNGFLLFSRDEKTRCDFESLIIVEYHDFDFMRNIYRREALGIDI